MAFIQELFTSRNNGVQGDDFVGKQGRIWWDPVTNCFYYSDGITPGGIPIGAGQIPAYGEYMTETHIATVGQTSFELMHSPSGHVTGAVNGATMNADALVETGTIITYDALNNEDYELREGDTVTFSYLFGTSNVSNLSNLGDVRLTNPQNGSVLIYDGASNQWVAGNPKGTFQYAIKNGTSAVSIVQPDGSVEFTIDGFNNRMSVTSAGINLKDAGYRVNGNLAVNGPTIKIENKDSTIVFDACDRPVTESYSQIIPAITPTTVEYARLCWDTAGKFNPIPNPILIGGVTIQPWSWRPMVAGYYHVTARMTLDAASANSGYRIESKKYFAKPAQTVFNILSVPKGTVVFSINGATVNANSITVSGTNVTYIPANNDGYVLLRDDSVVINYLLGTADTMTMMSESIIAVADQEEFQISMPSIGSVIASLNGAMLPSYMFTVNDTTITYIPEANEGYVIRQDDIMTISYLGGSVTTKLMMDMSIAADREQCVYYLPLLPSGQVIASLNGALLPHTVFRIQDTVAVYSPSANDGYVIRAGDVVTFTYIGSNTESQEWARMMILVNGQVKTFGNRSIKIDGEYDIEVDDVLLLTPDDNISIQVKHTVDPQLNVQYSSLASSMVRGIE